MRLRMFLGAAVIALAAVVAGSASAVLGGQPDGDQHPYVGYEDNGVFACSGTLLSPTVMLTAAHCFSDSESAFGTADGGSIVRVTFDPNLILTPSADRVWHYGVYYFDPQFTLAGGHGLPGFDTHDIALIIFGTPGCTVPDGATGTSTCGAITDPSTYGVLPDKGLVDTLKNGTPVDLVGYGDQNFIRGGGPCDVSCKPREGDAFTRFLGHTTLLTSKDRISNEFLKLQSKPSGTCFGDSGGPDLLGGTNIVLGINSFVNNATCAGNSYSYRADTQQARAWVTATVAAHPPASLTP